MSYYTDWKASTPAKAATSPEKQAILDKFKKQFLEKSSKFVDNEKMSVEDGDSKNKFFPGRDGLYLRGIYKIGGNNITIVEKVDECMLLDSPQKGIVDLSVTNKIPKELLVEIIGSFNAVYKDSGNEAAAQIYKKRDTGEYFIYYPEQTISKAQVSYPDDPNIVSLRTENELVCELHSHNSMSAFWSGTDDANEKEIGFYVVLGTFDRDATYKARVKYGANQRDLKLSDIFDISESEEAEILKLGNRTDGNKEIFSKIKKSAPATSYYTGYAEGKSYYGNWDYVKRYYSNYYDSVDDPYYKEYSAVVSGCNTSTATVDISNKNIYPSTDNFVKEIAEDYNLGMLDNDGIKYFDGRKLTAIKTELMVYDYKDYTNGYGFANGTLEDENTNIDVRANAYLLKVYSLALNYQLMDECQDVNDLYTSDDFVKTVYNLDKTSFTSLDWNLVAFWEGLSKYQKALIAYVFDQNVLFISQFVHEYEACNYYFIKFLASIILAPEKKLGVYLDFVREIDASFDYINKDKIQFDSEYETLSEVEMYFYNCLKEDLASGGAKPIGDVIDTLMGNTDVGGEDTKESTTTNTCKVVALQPNLFDNNVEEIKEVN